MNHTVRKLKKLFWLPLRWKLDAFFEAYGVEYPHPTVIQARMAELRAELLKARQEGNEVVAATTRGQLDALKWVLKYGKV